jgi:uncharacterized membrane protein YphA (DoxX/SURF4 family)
VNVALWIAQVLLAAMFVFAGAMKLMMPVEEIAKQISMPIWFVRFISVCELLGGVGLILPAVLRIATGLVPLAAAGLVIIMAGATVISLKGGVAMALIPFVIGLLAVFVAYGRWRLAPLRERMAR